MPAHQVVLTGIGTDAVMLQVGARTLKVAIADLSLYWYGDCVLLWHPATPPVEELRPGMRGPAVRSLRIQLLQADGTPISGVQSAAFDADLSQLVEAFQRAHHLTVDGVAGIETQLILDGVLAIPGTPTLQTMPVVTAATPG
jgi:general secretion pathway protein A